MARAEEQQLVVDLRLRDQLTGGLAKAKASVAGLDTQLKQTGTTLGGFGSSLGGIAKAGVAAFAVFKAIDLANDFFSAAIGGAIEEEAGIKRLTAALEANVPAWDKNIAAIERTIAARQSLGFSDDELRDSLSRAVGATNDVNKAFELQAIAMDLARFKGKSLEEATQALITVEAGQFRALKALGIELRTGASQTEALAAVQKVAAGQAKEYGDATAGAVAAAGIAFQNLAEDVGTLALPVLGDLASFASNDLIPALRDTAQAVKDLHDETADFLKPLADLLAEMRQLPSGAEGSITSIDGMRRVIAELIPETNLAIEKGRAFGGTWAESAEEAADALAEFGQVASDITGPLSGAALAILGVGAALTEVRAEAAATLGTLGALPASGDDRGLGPAAGLNRPRNEFLDDAKVTRAKVAVGRTTDAVDNLTKAFRDAERTADQLFDALHDRNVRAIRDAEQLANVKHDAALREIQDALAAQQAINAGPATAAQNALTLRTNAQQRRGLVESLQDARAAQQANTDPESAERLARAVRDATEALENFDAAAQVARLSEVQRTEDAKAQATADVATAKADAELERAKKLAQSDLDKETIAARKRKDDFDAGLAAIKARSDGKSPAQVQAEIDKLQGRFGITTDPVTGLSRIEDPLVTAIRTIRIPEPKVTLNFSPTLSFKVGVRELAAAIASQTSPTSTSAVRTGAAGRSG